MKHDNLHSKTWRRNVAAAAVTGAVAVLPLIGNTSVAQADPPRYAPAWGYRDRAGQSDRYDRSDRRFHDRYGRVAVRRNDYSGIVQQTFSGDQVSLSLDSGGSLRVAPGTSLPGRLRVGDRVSVHGYFTNGDSLFVADSLSMQSYRSHDRGYRR